MVNLGIAAWRWDSYLGEKAEKEGVRCQVSSWRRVHPSTTPPQAKSTANYASGALAKMEALKAGCEAIMLNVDSPVSEASAENIFRIKDGIISTPPASAGVLRGVTRDTIIRMSTDVGVEFRRSDISRERTLHVRRAVSNRDSGRRYTSQRGRRKDNRKRRMANDTPTQDSLRGRDSWKKSEICKLA